jgi:hypothetical protein
MKTKPKPCSAEIADQATKKVQAHDARLARIEADPLGNFALAIDALDSEGRLPPNVRKSVIEHLLVAAHGYLLRRQVEERTLMPSEQREVYEKIATSAEHLLGALGFADPAALAHGWPALPPSPPPECAERELQAQRELQAHLERTAGLLPPGLGLLLPELQRVAIERRASVATMGAFQRGMTLLLLLSDLVETAGRLSRELPGGRRGKPKGQPGAVAQLVHEIIGIYASVRRYHPGSGPKPAFGGPLVRFVRASLAVIDQEMETRTTDEMIRGHLNSWRQLPPKAQRPMGEVVQAQHRARRKRNRAEEG